MLESEENTPVYDAKSGRKQQQRSIVTQQKLLDAAILAFSQNGFKGTSTRDIADRAGVHHPLITYHFKNKDNLWRAATDKLFRDFHDSLAAAMDEVAAADIRARAEAYIRAYVEHAYRQPALHKITLQESSYPSDRLDWLIESHLKPMYEMISGPLRKLQELGVSPAGDTALLYNMIRVSAGGLLALGLELRGSGDIDFDDEAQREALADMIVQVFLPGDVTN